MRALLHYFYGRDEEKKGGNEVADHEDNDDGSIRCDLHTPFFASIILDAYLLSEEAWFSYMS